MKVLTSGMMPMKKQANNRFSLVVGGKFDRLFCFGSVFPASNGEFPDPSGVQS